MRVISTKGGCDTEALGYNFETISDEIDSIILAERNAGSKPRKRLKPRKKGKARRKGTPRPNPYARMPDADLEAEWERMLDECADRLEYFSALPEWQNVDNVEPIAADPKAWGLSRGEYRDWLESLTEHFIESQRLSDAAAERRRRLREAERERVSKMVDHEAAFNETASLWAPQEPCAYSKKPGEATREYIARIEGELDSMARWLGAIEGEQVVWERVAGKAR